MGNRKFISPVEAAALAVAVLVLVAWLVFPRLSGVQVAVTRSGVELGRYALDTPGRVHVQGANGFSLTLVIEDGAAWVEGSTCPDLICQHHAPISKKGEAIICLPGQVSVTVEGGEDYGPDTVSG